MLQPAKIRAVVGADRRADRKFRIGRIGFRHGGLGGEEEIVRHDQSSLAFGIYRSFT